ncbi:MAG: hypothetical protein ACJ72W_10325 [Actinoallomurus sp.]
MFQHDRCLFGSECLARTSGFTLRCGDQFGHVPQNLRASLYGGSDLRRDVPRFVDLWRGGWLDLESLITRRIRFEDLNDAIATLERGDAIRQVVLFD